MHGLAFLAVVFTSPLVSVAQDKAPGFDSPEQAFRAYVTGAITEDFDLMLSSLTRESKAYHIAISIFSATYLFSEDPSMQKVLRDHGITASSDSNERDEPDEKAFVDAMLKIKEPGKLMHKIAERHEALAKLLAKSDDAPHNKKRPTNKDLISSVALENVKIADDSATGFVNVAASAKGFLSVSHGKIEFRRIKKRWYCDIDPR